MYGQPAIAGGRLFAGADSGYVYALDAATGCVHWSHQAQAGVRTAVIIAPWSSQPSRYAAYFGDLRGNVYALDAASGELLWKTKVDEHGIARVTGTPALHGNRLYVPVASMEESTAANPNYSCCTFRGSVVALEASWRLIPIRAGKSGRHTRSTKRRSRRRKTPGVYSSGRPQAPPCGVHPPSI
jgi:polyvinyl alcohol dehydrogenase (cytochrome)